MHVLGVWLTWLRKVIGLTWSGVPSWRNIIALRWQILAAVLTKVVLLAFDAVHDVAQDALASRERSDEWRHSTWWVSRIAGKRLRL